MPFCYQSQASGIGKTEDRREFRLSPEQQNGSAQLHFGAVDYLNRGRNLELKNETTQIPASFSMRKPSVKAIFRGLSLFIEMGHQKAKNRKMGCKNYQMYLF